MAKSQGARKRPLVVKRGIMRYVKDRFFICGMRGNRGQGLVEYALIIGLVAVVAIAILSSLGVIVQGSYLGMIVDQLNRLM